MGGVKLELRPSGSSSRCLLRCVARGRERGEERAATVNEGVKPRLRALLQLLTRSFKTGA